MKRSFSLFSWLVQAVALFASPSNSAEISLSGTVTDLSGHVLSGAGVSLMGAGNSTNTNTSGVWSLSGSSAGIDDIQKSSAVPVTRHLVFDGNRIRLRFDGVDAAGRAASEQGGIGNGSWATGGIVFAVRSGAVSVDTLLYSWNGRVRARVGISSLLGGALGRQAIDTSTSSAITYDSLVHEGQTYKTVTIGTQTWMAENLNVKVDSSWCYGTKRDSCAKYGRLYTWAAAMKFPDSCNRFSCAILVQSHRQGICPTGWHVPSDSEWTTLVDYAGGVNKAGKRLKSTSGWSNIGDRSGNGTDINGFHALPAGNRTYDAYFNRAGTSATFWSSSEREEGFAWNRSLHSVTDDLSLNYAYKHLGSSVRCLKDGP